MYPGGGEGSIDISASVWCAGASLSHKSLDETLFFEINA